MRNTDLAFSPRPQASPRANGAQREPDGSADGGVVGRGLDINCTRGPPEMVNLVDGGIGAAAAAMRARECRPHLGLIAVCRPLLRPCPSPLPFVGRFTRRRIAHGATGKSRITRRACCWFFPWGRGSRAPPACWFGLGVAEDDDWRAAYNDAKLPINLSCQIAGSIVEYEVIMRTRATASRNVARSIYNTVFRRILTGHRRETGAHCANTCLLRSIA